MLCPRCFTKMEHLGEDGWFCAECDEYQCVDINETEGEGKKEGE